LSRRRSGPRGRARPRAPRRPSRRRPRLRDRPSCAPRPPPQGAVMNRKLTAALLVAAAVLSDLAFTALGAVFDYPGVLKEPVDDVLAAFRDNQGAVTFRSPVLSAS